MNQVNANKIGLVFGGFFGLAHLVWSVLLALGWAGPLLDFVLRMHSMQLPFVLTPFSWSRSLGLIVLTSLVGYVDGWILGTIWNKVHKS